MLALSQNDIDNDALSARILNGHLREASNRVAEAQSVLRDIESIVPQKNSLFHQRINVGVTSLNDALETFMYRYGMLETENDVEGIHHLVRDEYDYLMSLLEVDTVLTEMRVYLDWQSSTSAIVRKATLGFRVGGSILEAPDHDTHLMYQFLSAQTKKVTILEAQCDFKAIQKELLYAAYVSGIGKSMIGNPEAIYDYKVWAEHGQYAVNKQTAIRLVY